MVSFLFTRNLHRKIEKAVNLSNSSKLNVFFFIRLFYSQSLFILYLVNLLHLPYRIQYSYRKLSAIVWLSLSVRLRTGLYNRRKPLNAIVRLCSATQYSIVVFFCYASKYSCWCQSFSLPLYRNDSSVGSWPNWFVAAWISLVALLGSRVSV